eukprot:TRINITY_DN2749_c0_g2_i3.p1 TRINITY_DN2749_c0_g2~~TRINITY_DN2749_c0_g2_i3.p1  ORF type:complete len:740 (-),score=122.99 TRINITY_DN2749_c0_g2_i3:59-2278(-)
MGVIQTMRRKSSSAGHAFMYGQDSSCLKRMRPNDYEADADCEIIVVPHQRQGNTAGTSQSKKNKRKSIDTYIDFLRQAEQGDESLKKQEVCIVEESCEKKHFDTPQVPEAGTEPTKGNQVGSEAQSRVSQEREVFRSNLADLRCFVRHVTQEVRTAVGMAFGRSKQKQPEAEDITNISPLREQVQRRLDLGSNSKGTPGKKVAICIVEEQRPDIARFRSEDSRPLRELSIEMNRAQSSARTVQDEAVIEEDRPLQIRLDFTEKPKGVKSDPVPSKEFSDFSVQFEAEVPCESRSIQTTPTMTKCVIIPQSQEAQANERLHQKEEEIKELKKQISVLIDLMKTKEDLLCEKDNTIAEIKDEVAQKKDCLIMSEKCRQLLHQQLQEMRGRLRIFCRIKPQRNVASECLALPERDQVELSEQKSYKIVELHGSIAGKQTKQNFIFDRVFDQSTTQQDVFEEMKYFVQSAIDGEHVSILAYGQTGSGKTYTMEGLDLASSAGKKIVESSGIIPRALDFIFAEKQRLISLGITLEMELACLEIYNDNITDLLSGGEKRQPSGDQQKFNIHMENGRVVVQNLCWTAIESHETFWGCIRKAYSLRTVDKNFWNERSSRSHCIYRLKLVNSSKQKEGLLTFVDLAGSERSEPTQDAGADIQHKKKIQNEANFINKSLTTLGRIVRMIADKSPNTAIPYRESKLTRLLQDSLGAASSQTLLFVNVCPSSENFLQTKESLIFGSKAVLN